MHAGLNLPDGEPDIGASEVRQVATELERLAPGATQRSEIALIFDYQAQSLLDSQPQGADFNYLRLVYDLYAALRHLGVDIDIPPPDAEVAGYRAVVIPSLPVVPDALVRRLTAFPGPVLIGPRSGSKTEDLPIPATLPLGPLQPLLPLRIVRVESLRPGISEPVDYAGYRFQVTRWRELIESKLVPEARFSDSHGALYRNRRYCYLAGWPDTDLRRALLQQLCREAGITILKLPSGLRLRRRGGLCFAVNYGPDTVRLPVPEGTDLVLGTRRLALGEVAAWRLVET